MLFFLNQFIYHYKRPVICIFKRLLIKQNKWYRITMLDKDLPRRSDPVIKILDSPEFKSIFTPELIALADIFKKYNYELRIAGGAVRDILMNIKPKDLDFATTATPDEMKEMFDKEEVRMINCNGEKHGTVTPRINNSQNFEITTIRFDVATNGRHAEVMFTKDWLLDANRRDLTINSMYLDLDGKVYDYFYGYDDLLKRKIRFVGDPSKRICEDFLRILRYFRFYGRVNEVPDNHDEATIQAIKDNITGLEIISGERIWSEWSKIFEGNFCRELTLKMLECGCGKYMGLPEKINYEEFNAVCLNAQKNNIKLRPISYASALLHTVEEVLDLFLRLKFTKYERNLGLFLIENQHQEINENSIKLYQKMVLKTITKASDAIEYVCELFRYKGALDLAVEFKKWNPKFPFSGNAILPFVEDKKMIGLVLSKLKDLWVDSNFTMTTADLNAYVPEVIEKIQQEIEYGHNNQEETFGEELGNKKEYKKKYGKRKLSI